ncbi:MAG: glycoside hydrolase family 27 protein [Mycobacterium sp.]|nr:glycoside hydrolase family 27 protein [Mycobacterium sp.]
MRFSPDCPKRPGHLPWATIVLAGVALIVAVTGMPAATAATLIETDNTANDAVNNPRIVDHAVGSAKLRDRPVGNVTLRSDAFGPRILRGGAVTVGNGLARTPPMGWNGYNHYSRAVTASIVRAQARSLVSSGMKAAGYTYVNLDGGWNLLHRNAHGALRADPRKFPHGIAPLAAYVHSLGLKFGIYASVGKTNCARTAAGSWRHYRQDAKTFASWGVDFVKVDWCNVPRFPGMTAEQVARMLFGRFGRALRSASRPMLYSLSTNRPALAAWTWAPSVGNMWRTTRDIKDRYASMLAHLALNAQHARAAGPGGWNDPDMLEVGNGGMTRREDRAEFSLWAEMAAPLIAGNDLTRMSAATRRTLTNQAIIAVDQDRLGRQGHILANANGHWVLAKPLVNGARAIVLFNQTDQSTVISTTAPRVGLPAATSYRVTRLWEHITTTTTGTIREKVAPHSASVLRVSPS